MVGGTLTIPVLHYSRTSSFREEDPTTDVTNNFDFAQVDEDVSTKGIGINAKLGLIFKPVEYLRLGLAFHSPTLYSLKDVYDVSITADAESGEGILTDYMTDYTNDQPAEFPYVLVTPYRAIASVAYVLREVEDITKQKGFITADIEYVDYTAASFKPDDEAGIAPEDKDYLQSLNTAIDVAYKPAFNFRMGGELKFTTLMVRAGAAYYGNPYKSGNGEKGSKLNLSGGLGYRNKGMFVDLTYVHSLNKDVHFPYRLESDPYQGARINSSLGNILATVGFKF
jgi:long-subunit fatty acid transport protein